MLTWVLQRKLPVRRRSVAFSTDRSELTNESISALVSSEDSGSDIPATRTPQSLKYKSHTKEKDDPKISETGHTALESGSLSKGLGALGISYLILDQGDREL